MNGSTLASVVRRASVNPCAEPYLGLKVAARLKSKLTVAASVLACGGNEVNIGVLGTRPPPELLFPSANVTRQHLNLVATLEAQEVVSFKASVPLQGLMERPRHLLSAVTHASIGR